MLFYFDIDINPDSDLHGILRKAGEALENHHGCLWSDGRFELETKIGGFAGSVIATKGNIRVIVDKKPGFVSKGAVVKKIRELFAEAQNEKK